MSAGVCAAVALPAAPVHARSPPFPSLPTPSPALPAKAVHLSVIKTRVLERVLAFLLHHDATGVPCVVARPLTSSRLEDVRPALDPFDVQLVSCEQEMLLELTLAAGFLDLQGLLDLCAASVACSLLGKPAEQARQVLGLQNDFSAEELASIEEENRAAGH